MMLDEMRLQYNMDPIGVIPSISLNAQLVQHVKSVNISRGKNARFSSFPAATMEVRFNNNDRRFDPEYDHDFTDTIIGFNVVTSSNIYWNPSKTIAPRYRIWFYRQGLGISDPNKYVFSGFVTDWNIVYNPDGTSDAILQAVDVSAPLSAIALSASTPTEELAGERIIDIFDQISANDYKALSYLAANIDDGLTTLGTQAISEGTNAIAYLNKIAETDGGYLFVNRNGSYIYKQRVQSVGSYLSFGANDIPFSALVVDYGSELLYNRVVASNIGGGTAVAENTLSISGYGVKELVLSDLLGTDDASALDLATYLAASYGLPKYRIIGLDINVTKYFDDKTTYDKLLDLDLLSFCEIKHTPSGIGPEIVKKGAISAMQHTITPESWVMTLAFEDEIQTILQLDGGVFGKLDSGNVLG